MHIKTHSHNLLLFNIIPFNIFFVKYFYTLSHKIYFAGISLNVPAVTDVFFAPDKEKCEAFLRAQKNVAEQNTTKGVARLLFCVA
jgi:hypothetical protein